MNQVQADKYNIAWFRLAECISRKEKERALGVYRLLSHSFDNAAVGFQLEGDILCAFNDTDGAIKLYEKAAQTYQDKNQYMQAVAVYDHLFTLQDNQIYIEKIIELYAQLKDQKRMFYYVKHLCHLLLRKQAVQEMLALLGRFDMQMAQKALLLVDITFIALRDNLIEPQIKLQLVQQTLDRLMYDAHILRQFLAQLKAVDERAYEMACAYVQGE
jgi:tetratricopeptide (TPR) repeat protein